MSTEIGRVVGPTILLGSGTYYDFESPETSQITIEDIAWGLAGASRFAGQTWSRVLKRRVLYSTAQHCVLMSKEAPRGLELAALMHEAGEPVCGDMVGPLKKLLPEYKAIEKRCERANLAHFGITISDPAAIKALDLRMLATEQRDLMNWHGEEWAWTEGAAPFDHLTIVPWPPEIAAQRFIDRYEELTVDRTVH